MAIALFEKVFSLFSASGDADSEKRKQIKQLGKELSKHKYKFYKPRSEEVEPSLAKFFYDIYKVVAPAQVFLQNALSSSQLRAIAIDAFLDKKQLDLQERLGEESISERAKTVPTKELSVQVKDELIAFFGGFDTEKTRNIDDTYSGIVAFVNFVNYDYFFLLKKFDSNISERNFTYHPKFDSIRSEYVAEDVKDFLEFLLALNLDRDWKALFSILKLYKGVDVVAVDQWAKMVGLLRDVKRSGILELMIRHIDKNPTWQSKMASCEEHIVEPYLQKLKAQIEVTIQKHLQEKRNAKIDQLATMVFGTTAVLRLKNYTDKANIAYSKKMLGGFIHVQGLNYLKAFLLDYFKKDVRELVDLFLIRGQWSTNMLSQQLSEGYHELMTVSETLITFDDGLADDGDIGARLKSALMRADRDKEQVKTLRLQLKSVNDEAQKLISNGAQSLIVIGKNLKNILEDFQRAPHELIINWKELEMTSEIPIDQRITEVYKKIYYFIQLMQFFAKSEPAESQLK